MTKNSFFFLFGTFLLFMQSCTKDPVPVAFEPEVAIPYVMDLPKGFQPMAIPEDNPMTVQGVELGRALFYETRLSGDNTQACASCHVAEAGFSDPRRFSEGINGSLGNRNAMAIVNLGFSNFFFWDGRSSSLEEQALDPVTNPIEMNATWPEVLTKLNADAVYRNKFKVAFDVDVIDSLDVAKALAQFERTLISGNSKYDRYWSFEATLTESEKRGMDLFFDERADCKHCHGTKLTMGYIPTNNGLQQTIVDQGVGGVNGNPFDIGKFKPPSLRNIEFTAPYMHDGRFETLEEVVEFYNSGVNQSSPNISVNMIKKNNRPDGTLGLTEQDKKDLVAFLRTLSDEEFINNPAFSKPE